MTMYQTVIKYPPKLKYARIRAEETGRVESTRRVWWARSHLALRRESRREDEALGEATIESKTTAKKRTRSRASLGSDIGELVACRGLNEA